MLRGSRCSTRPCPSMGRAWMLESPGLGFTQTYFQKVQTMGEGLLNRLVGCQVRPSSKLSSTDLMPSRLPTAYPVSSKFLPEILAPLFRSVNRACARRSEESDQPWLSQ